MPIFFQQDIDGDTKLGIWKIEEDEDFFLRSVVPQRNVTHPHKKLQHLAGRYLLKYLFPDFPLSLILIADTRKPYLENEAYHFSISHCGQYAASIVSKNKRVGVDVEMVSSKIDRIKHKFLSEEEWGRIGSQEAVVNSKHYPELSQTVVNREMLTVLESLTLLWSCKEAVFKWYGLGEVDFKEHIVSKTTNHSEDNRHDTIISFEKEASRFLMLQTFVFKEAMADEMPPSTLILSYVVT